MTEHSAGVPRSGADDAPEAAGPVIRDKRKIDPTTGVPREAESAVPTAASEQAGGPAGDAELEAARAQAAEHLADLQRVQAEYVNYRRRVDRDRDVAREQAIAGMVEALVPALDDIELARQHGELEGGPFASIAEKIEAVLARFGWERYGEAGEPFDPTVHEALMHSHSAQVSEPTVVQVLQHGHRVGERLVRAARVAVAEPGQ